MSGRTARIAFAIASRSFVTPVEVSLWVTMTALKEASFFSASAICAGSAAVPCSNDSFWTFTP